MISAAGMLPKGLNVKGPVGLGLCALLGESSLKASNAFLNSDPFVLLMLNYLLALLFCCRGCGHGLGGLASGSGDSRLTLRDGLLH